MKIVCIYKSGGDYDWRYVAAMNTGLHEHCPDDFDFYCLTDKPDEVSEYANIVELKHDLPGWWSKIELFNPELFYDDIVIYMDLDVLILKDISNLVRAAKNSFYPVTLRSRDPYGEQKDWPSSSIMSWKGRNMNEVYNVFFQKGKDKVIEETKKNISRAGQRTDQGFIRTVINPDKFQDVLPEGYVIYKLDYNRYPAAFKKAHILNWTGKPRFHAMSGAYEHIRLIWESRYQIYNQ